MTEKVAKRRGYTDRQRVTDYRATFGTEEGKRVLRDLMSRYWFFAGTFHTDAGIMQFREGERNVVLDLVAILEMTPADIPEVRASMVEQFGLEPADETQ